MIIEYFFQNFQGLLDKNNLSQLSLSKLVKIPRGTINNWFNRKAVPPIETVEQLASFFGVEPHYFFMKPGTQEEPKQASVRGSFDEFIDEAAHKILSERDLELYKQAGGPSAFLDRMRTNYETDRLSLEDWYVLINEFLKPYIALDIQEKVRRKLSRQEAGKKSDIA